MIIDYQFMIFNYTYILLARCKMTVLKQIFFVLYMMHIL